MSVRPATTEDVAVIRLVAERAWSADYPDSISRETVAAGVHEWYDEAVLTEAIEREDAMVLVATADGEIAGFLHAVVADGAGNVLRVYVHPDERGAGLGSDLLSAATERLFERGVDRIRAMVLADNDAGNEFYRTHGFEQTPETHETDIGGEYYDERVWVLDREADPEESETSRTATPT